MPISVKDRIVLRELAKKQVELASSLRNQQLYADWALQGHSHTPIRPFVRIEIETFEQEILPGLMKCESAEARNIEMRMLRPIANFTLFQDDTLVPEYYPITPHVSFLPFGLQVRKQETGSLGHHFIPYLHDLEEDAHLLKPSIFSIDEEGTQKEIQQAQEIFGDILPVNRINNCIGCVPTQNIIHIMNMDDMYMAMLDDEERFHSMMRRLTDDYLAYFRQMEAGGHLRSAAKNQRLNQGSYCFTDELQDGISGAALRDMWLFMDSQETAGISPRMYEELIFPYYKEIMDCFGLVSYGCCEAAHPIWDNCLSKISNLRKISISPWCNEEFMGERLQGTRITYLRKPPSTLLGMNTSTLDEDATLACFRKTAKAARGCKLEVAQRDIYTVGSCVQKVKRYVELARIGLES